MPVGSLELHACSRAQLDAITRPSTLAFRLRLPTKKGKRTLSPPTIEKLAQEYDIFRTWAQHPDLVLYGVGKINGTISTQGYRLELWGEQLMLQSLVRPQDLAERDELPAVRAKPKDLLMADAILNALVEDEVDEALFTDERIAKLAKLMEEKAGAEVIPIEGKPVDAEDLASSLEKALLAARKKVA